MKLLEALEHGACGVRYQPPAHAVVRASEREALAFTDGRAALEWLVHFGDVALDLSPDHDALLAADADRAARAIYRATAANLDARAPKGAAPDPHRDDPAWSPLVRVGPAAVGVCAGLVAVHRTADRPSLRAAQGHLLLPTQYGVVEFRVTATDRAPLPGEGSPEHCVARVEAALASLRTSGVVEVTRPPLAPAVGDVALPAFGGALTLPARFALAGGAERDVALFTRVSLCNTDGVWRLALAREDGDAIARQRALRKRVESALAAHFGLADLRAARVELSHAADGAARVTVAFETAPLASVWWLHTDGGLRGLQLSGPDGTSPADVLPLLLPAAASWRTTPNA
ncbi:MAG: hypothetical protein U0324_03525 [Polyangiales bacterium]